MNKPIIIQKPTLAIVGRTNVGKSTLFNRLIEEARALVSNLPGTTRSPNYSEAIWCGRMFTVIDTGGLDKRSGDVLASDISREAKKVISQADLVLFLIDLKVGLTSQDRELAKFLRLEQRPVILVGNKAEKETIRQETQRKKNWLALGLGELYPISAVTGLGVGDLLDAALRKLKEINRLPPTLEEELKPIKVAIIGKPNVGKSSLLNALVGAPRALVSEIAHTTREPQDTLIRLDDHFYLLIDTAGIRRKLKLGSSLEAVGVRKSLVALARADLVLLVLDLTQQISAEDRNLVGLALEKTRGLILVGNKWDLVPDKKPDLAAEVARWLKDLFPFAHWAPIIFVSAKSGQHTHQLFPLIRQIQERRKQEIDPGVLDQFFRQVIRAHRPSRGRGLAHPYLYSFKQIGTEPPTFEVAVRGRRETLHPSYLRFLENRLREKFDFSGTPILITAKSVRPKI